MFRVTNTIVENNFGAPKGKIFFMHYEIVDISIGVFFVLCHIVIAFLTIIERAIMKIRKELK